MHCSYERKALIGVGGFPEDMRAGEDTVVNRALFDRGHRAYRSAEVTFVHHSRCERWGQLITHHFSRGRAFGKILRRNPRRYRVVWTYVPRRLLRTGRDVRRWGGVLRREYRRVWFLVFAGTVAAWLGIVLELLRPAPVQPSTTSPAVVATMTRQK